MFGEPGKASVVVGGQFGSEGKGLYAAWLAEKIASEGGTICTTNAGAQAGHTTRYLDGKKFVCFHLPTIGVIKKNSLCYINAGSIIDVDQLFAEIEACEVDPTRIFIHPRAAVITNENRETERAHGSSTEKTASTQKGVGAAISDKIMRRAKLAKDDERLGRFIKMMDLNQMLHEGYTVTVEVPQGHDLSINHGLSYPSCTSRDCWVGSGLSDAGIHPRFLGQVAMVVRTFPIRVGGIINEMGEVLGESGPFYADSKELQWDAFPGVEPERTTVTKRVRRIATWSRQQYRRALRLNRPDEILLNFVNYLPSDVEFWNLFESIRDDERAAGVNPMHAFGVGPCTEEIITDVKRTASWLTSNR